MTDSVWPGGNRWRKLLLAISVSPLLTACVVGIESGPQPSPPEPVPAPDVGELPTVPLQVLEAPGATLAFVPVYIADRGPYMFALDTGASSIVLDTTIADELRLARTGERRDISGVIGREQVEVAHVEEWWLGDVPLEATDVALLDLPTPERGDGLQGLLGSDVLSDFDYVVVDYDDRRLALAPAG